MPDWPHAPVHLLTDAGAYMVTCGTYRKLPLLNDTGKLDFVRDMLFEVARELKWSLQAWAILANHYHFVALSPEDPASLPEFCSKLHMRTAKELNIREGQPGRRVWYQYWDSHITFERSYLARLNYVHNNPVHHRVVEAAPQYPWCSAAWFERTAGRAFWRTVADFKTDRLNVKDDF